MLVGATAAPSEVRALGRHPMWRRFEQLDQFSFGKLLFLTHDFCRDAFAFNRERNEDRLAFVARDPFAAKSNVDEFELNLPHGGL
jgi:hypothetical protein